MVSKNSMSGLVQDYKEKNSEMVLGLFLGM